MENVFIIPGTERVQPHYFICEDRFEKNCETVLVAVTRDFPFLAHAPNVVPLRKTKSGHWFGLFRTPKESIQSR